MKKKFIPVYQKGGRIAQPQKQFVTDWLTNPSRQAILRDNFIEYFNSDPELKKAYIATYGVSPEDDPLLATREAENYKKRILETGIQFDPSNPSGGGKAYPKKNFVTFNGEELNNTNVEASGVHEFAHIMNYPYPLKGSRKTKVGNKLFIEEWGVEGTSPQRNKIESILKGYLEDEDSDYAKSDPEGYKYDVSTDEIHSRIWSAREEAMKKFGWGPEHIYNKEDVKRLDDEYWKDFLPLFKKDIPKDTQYKITKDLFNKVATNSPQQENNNLPQAKNGGFLPTYQGGGNIKKFGMGGETEEQAQDGKRKLLIFSETGKNFTPTYNFESALDGTYDNLPGSLQTIINNAKDSLDYIKEGVYKNKVLKLLPPSTKSNFNALDSLIGLRNSAFFNYPSDTTLTTEEFNKQRQKSADLADNYQKEINKLDSIYAANNKLNIDDISTNSPLEENIKNALFYEYGEEIIPSLSRINDIIISPAIYLSEEGYNQYNNLANLQLSNLEEQFTFHPSNPATRTDKDYDMFVKDAKKLGEWYKKNKGYDYFISPTYGDSIKVKNLLSNIDSLDDVAIYGHSDSRIMGGLPNSFWNRVISEKNPRNCILGTCTGERVAETLPDVKNIWGTKGIPFFGTNPYFKNLQDVLIQNTNQEGVYRTPKKGENWDIYNPRKQNGGLINYATGGQMKKQNNAQFYPTYYNGTPMYGFGSWLGKNSENLFQVAGGLGDSFIPGNTMAGSIGKGALSGAATGAALGPWGAAAGAVLGGIGGIFNKKATDNAQNAAKAQQQAEVERQYMMNEANNPNAYFAAMGGMVNRGGGYMNTGLNFFNDGGQMKGYTQFPVGGKHEQNKFGGIPLGNQALVEQDEYLWSDPEYGKYVFSNKF